MTAMTTMTGFFINCVRRLIAEAGGWGCGE